MKKDKMIQTREAKKKYSNPIKDLLIEKRTKQELANILNLSLRKVREEICECSMHYPVISFSDTCGYRRAKPIDKLSMDELIEELGEVEASINDRTSRITVLKKKLKPLIAYKKVAKKRLKELTEEVGNE